MQCAIQGRGYCAKQNDEQRSHGFHGPFLSMISLKRFQPQCRDSSYLFRPAIIKKHLLKRIFFICFSQLALFKKQFQLCTVMIEFSLEAWVW